MNKNAYRVIFNKSRGQFMAVCEVATAQGKGATGAAEGARSAGRAPTLTALSLAVCLAAGSAGVLAAPVGGQVMQGNAAISQQGALTSVQQNSQRAIVNWQSFGVNAGETVRFNQPNVNAAILNRVTGALPSSLNGLIEGNGKVFLVNPNGIVLGQNGIVNVQGGFVASTQNLNDAAFMAGDALNFAARGRDVGLRHCVLLQRGSLCLQRPGGRHDDAHYLPFYHRKSAVGAAFRREACLSAAANHPGSQPRPPARHPG